LVGDKKKNAIIVKPVAGISMSIVGKSTVKKCSKFSYTKNAQNRINTTVAYFKLIRPVFMYEETDLPIITAANNEATTYMINSVWS
jgi:hypothetical protein